MTIVSVAAPTRRYDITLGAGLLSQTESWTPWVAGRRVFIVTNTTIAPLYASAAEQACREARGTQVIVLPDGEAYKTSATMEQIYSPLLAAGADRNTIIVALGGGVIGDMAGFAAATYQRGIDFIQAPTTLLAMVDSSVGGKTGINHPLGKNMIGAFHQPLAVLADLATLNSLPAREYAAGIAEAIKHGLVADAAYLDTIESSQAALQRREPTALAALVKRSCEIKANIVARDEHETTDVRALLNLGHTFGHAIEAGMGYGEWLHGEAVSAGLMLAARFSHALGHVGSADVDRIQRLLTAFSLPVRPPRLTAEEMLSHMSRDKKNAQGQIKLVLLKRTGEAYLDSTTSREALRGFLKAQMPA
jgi:3-dehydroquinate synthase